MVQVRKMLDGNGAAAEALRLARVRVVAAYPITPQSPIAESLAGWVLEGSLEARYVRVESEHSALSCVIGTQLTGVRAATATSSVGLAYMHEVLGVAAGCRLPIVMPVVNRALVSPWSLWCDHGDAMSVREAGWVQLYATNAQECLDLVVLAYRVCEDERVLLPAMVCMDGFFVSHATEPVLVPDQAAVDRFVGSYLPRNLVLDVDRPMFVNDLTPPEDFTEMRFQQKCALEAVTSVWPEVAGEFARLFGRSYGLIEADGVEGARAVLVVLGSAAGTARQVAGGLRRQGKPVGVLRICCFRPFPFRALREALADVPVIGVLDRSAGLGAEGGPVLVETRSALAPQGGTGGGRPQTVVGFVAGLGGRDITPATLERALSSLLEVAEGALPWEGSRWMDLGPDPFAIRVFPPGGTGGREGGGSQCL
ncbi:MAG: pyruvate ferredoxin oxidoreductase [Bacillota bacterium]|nr:pyruvate ferredoxin oxidoreductase [Bacillota bacterium]